MMASVIDFLFFFVVIANVRSDDLMASVIHSYGEGALRQLRGPASTLQRKSQFGQP